MRQGRFGYIPSALCGARWYHGVLRREAVCAENAVEWEGARTRDLGTRSTVWEIDVSGPAVCCGRGEVAFGGDWANRVRERNECESTRTQRSGSCTRTMLTCAHGTKVSDAFWLLTSRNAGEESLLVSRKHREASECACRASCAVIDHVTYRRIDDSRSASCRVI